MLPPVQRAMKKMENAWPPQCKARGPLQAAGRPWRLRAISDSFMSEMVMKNHGRKATVARKTDTRGAPCLHVLFWLRVCLTSCRIEVITLEATTRSGFPGPDRG
jgi:hypothetical protein